MDKLTWELDKILGCSGEDITSGGWVHLDETSGDKNVSPKITTDAATKIDDCQTATVVLLLSNGEYEYINVSRCLPTCECETINFTPISSTITVGATGATGLKIGTYSSTSACAKYVSFRTSGVVLNPRNSGNNILVDIPENTEKNQKTGDIRVYLKNKECGRVSITQDRYVSPCETGKCDDILISPTEMTFVTEGGAQDYSITASNCWAITEISDSWINVSSDKISVGKNESETSKRTGNVTFKLINGEAGIYDCTKVINVEQAFTPPPPPSTCSCESVTIEVHNIPQTGTTSQGFSVATINVTSDCSDKFIVGENPFSSVNIKSLPGVNKKLEYNSGEREIIIKGVTENTEKTPKDFNFKFNYTINGKSCVAAISGTQAASTKKCGAELQTAVVKCNTETNTQYLLCTMKPDTGCADKGPFHFDIYVGREPHTNVTVSQTGTSIPLRDKVESEEVNVTWYNLEDDERGGSMIATVEKCTDPTPVIVVPNLKFNIAMSDEIINTVQIRYCIKYKEESGCVNNSGYDTFIINTTGNNCEFAMRNIEVEIPSETFNRGAISDYKIEFTIVNVHGWDTAKDQQGNCVSHSDKQHEFLWSDAMGVWTTEQTHTINLSSINTYTAYINVVTRMKQNN